MIATNELGELKCNKLEVLKPLVILLAPFAPHISDELWQKIGEKNGSVHQQKYPEFDEKYLVESNFDYPVSFNGKMRFKVNLSLSLKIPDIEKIILSLPDTQKWLENNTPKKIIIVPGKIVNIVL
jgi:leucyl-tRNA synthetase